MDIKELLSGIDCSCGKHHECGIDSVIIGNGAISELKKLTDNYSDILIVADGNTYGAAGERVALALEGKKYSKVIFDGKSILIPDEKAISKVNESLRNADLILGIGSGVIQDLCKYVSKFSSVPYMVVATAPSMDGYASTGAAMILEGMKVTVSAGLPRAIICDTEVLKNAPMEMIKAGYGDVIGKYSALSDWRLSNIINGEYLCEYIYSVTEKMIEKTLGCAEGLLRRDENAVGVLAEALIVVGIMMSFAGSSRPASGSEHHLSHFFEIVGIVKDEPYLPHGINVAYSTVMTAALREKLLNADFNAKRYRLSRTEYEKKMSDIYGKVADGCISLQDKIGNYSADRMSIYKEKEKEIKNLLSEMPSAKEIEKMLSRCEMNISEFYSVYGKEKIDTALLYSKDLKDRYTVLWLAYDLGLGI